MLFSMSDHDPDSPLSCGNQAARHGFAAAKPGADKLPTNPRYSDATNRAHAGKALIKSRLIPDLDPEEWDLPPKPEMDALGYNRYEARYDEDVLDYGCAALAAKLMVIPEPVMPELNNLRAEIERKRTQVHRQRGEI